MIRLFMLVVSVLSVASCTPAVPKESSLQGHNLSVILNKTWQWEATVTAVERILVVGPERYTIRFAEAGKLQAKFDCNSGGGSYTLTEGAVTFGPLFSTRMACPEGTQDAVFMRDLQRVKSYFLKEGLLFLELPYDSGTMRFLSVP